jgi:hypothetical protein
MKKLLILLILCMTILMSNAYAWDCTTHQKICDMAGYSNFDCCAADVLHLPASFYHHCEANGSNCAARTQADIFLSQGNLAIAAHLYSDSMCPAHWGSYANHSVWEKQMGLNDTLVQETVTYLNYKMNQTLQPIRQNPDALTEKHPLVDVPEDPTDRPSVRASITNTLVGAFNALNGVALRIVSWAKDIVTYFQK